LTTQNLENPPHELLHQFNTNW